MVGELTIAGIDTFYTKLRTGSGGAKGLSGGIVQRVHVVLRSALAQALRWEWIGDNPAAHTARIVAPSREPNPPTVEELAALLGHLESRDPALHAFVVVAAMTGARRAQVLGLRWRNTNFDAVTVVSVLLGEAQWEYVDQLPPEVLPVFPIGRSGELHDPFVFERRSNRRPRGRGDVMGFVDEERVELCGEGEPCFFGARVERVGCGDYDVAAACEGPCCRERLQPLRQPTHDRVGQRPVAEGTDGGKKPEFLELLGDLSAKCAAWDQHQ